MVACEGGGILLFPPLFLNLSRYIFLKGLLCVLEWFVEGGKCIFSSLSSCFLLLFIFSNQKNILNFFLIFLVCLIFFLFLLGSSWFPFFF